MAKILAIGAHSDDIEFYAGGTLSLMANSDEIVLIVATDGRHGTHDSLSQEALIKKRINEQTRAATHIGIRKILHLNFEDSELEFHTRELKQSLRSILMQENPDIIFTFDPEKQFVLHEDFHPDHRTLALSALDVILIDATLPSKGGISQFYPQIYLFNPYRINQTIDISKTKNQKLRALKEYTSQKDVIEKQLKDENEEYFYKYR